MTTPELPKAARELIAHATENGWTVLVHHGTDTDQHPFVTIQVGRVLPFWHFRLTWHTRATHGATYRLFSKIHYHMPVDGRGTGWLGTPSLRYVTETITANPRKD